MQQSSIALKMPSTAYDSLIPDREESLRGTRYFARLEHAARNAPSLLREETVSMLQKYMEDAAKIIDLEFRRFSARYFAGMKQEFIDIVNDYPERPGKKLRPGLILLTAEAFGLRQSDVMNLALGIEVMHNGYLIPDDIYDNAELRRGKPVLHHKVGQPRAINAGGELLNMAWYLINDFVCECYENGKPDVARAVSMEYRAMTAAVSTGQDLEERCKGAEALKPDNEPLYNEICRLKTASYTAAFPVIVGAISAGRYDEATLSAIREIFFHFGVAFQLADDLQDVIGKEASAGDLSNLKERKLRLDFLHVVKEAPIGISRRISEIYAKPADAIDKSDLKYLADAIKRYGGVEYMKRRMKMELHIARKLWHSYNVFPSNKFSKMLEAMIDSDMLEEYTRE